MSVFSKRTTGSLEIHYKKRLHNRLVDLNLLVHFDFIFEKLTEFCCLPLGFYLISPSEFERFSMSARYLVEPRCLVEVPLHTGSSNQHRPQPHGASTAHTYMHFKFLYLI